MSLNPSNDPQDTWTNARSTSELDRAERNFKRWVMIGLVALGFSAAVSGVAAIISVNQTFRPLEPSLIYLGDWAMPSPITACPGDVLTFRVTVVVDRTPVVIEITDSWWSVAQGNNVVLGAKAYYSVVTSPEHFTAPLTVTVPAGLPAGAYEYRRAAWQRFAATQAFALPLTIKDSCP